MWKCRQIPKEKLSIPVNVKSRVEHKKKEIPE